MNTDIRPVSVVLLLGAHGDGVPARARNAAQGRNGEKAGRTRRDEAGAQEAGGDAPQLETKPDRTE